MLLEYAMELRIAAEARFQRGPHHVFSPSHAVNFQEAIQIDFLAVIYERNAGLLLENGDEAPRFPPQGVEKLDRDPPTLYIVQYTAPRVIVRATDANGMRASEQLKLTEGEQRQVVLTLLPS